MCTHVNVDRKCVRPRLCKFTQLLFLDICMDVCTMAVCEISTFYNVFVTECVCVNMQQITLVNVQIYKKQTHS